MIYSNNCLKYILALSVFAASLFPGVAVRMGAEDLKQEFNPVETGVTSLSIAPDARGASMGDLGAATDPDVNSQFWNPSKYAFAYSQGGVSLSYTPWLRKLVNDYISCKSCGLLEDREQRQPGCQCVAALFLVGRGQYNRP